MSRRKRCSSQCCSGNGLLILILIILKFGCSCGCKQNGCIDNSILFIIAIYYLSCCKDFDLGCIC